MKNRNLFCNAHRSSWLVALLALAAVLAATWPVRAAVNQSAVWNGSGASTNAFWSNPANWSTGTGLVAPPANPMQQLVPGNGFGDIDFTTAPNPSLVDSNWTVSVLYFPFGNSTLGGADLTVQQSAGTLGTYSLAAIQLGGNSTYGSGPVNITNNILFDDAVYLGNGSSQNMVWGNNANGTLNFYGNMTMTNLNKQLLFSGISPVNLYGKMKGAGGYNTANAPVSRYAQVAPPDGPLTFYNDQNDFGWLEINWGTVAIGIKNGLPTNAVISYDGNHPCTLNLNDFDQTVAYINDVVTAQPLSLNTGAGAGGTVTLKDNGVTNELFSLVISGNGGLVKNGNGILIFDQDQTFVGPTTVNGGTLQLGGPNNSFGAGTLASVNITNNGTLIINRAVAPTLANLYGSGALQVLGSGGLTINGPYTYSGPTTIANGTLTLGASGVLSTTAAITLANSAATVDASAGGGVQLAAGQSLTGLGTIKGTVTLGAGASVSPGLAPASTVGTLTLINDATLNGPSIAIDLGNDPATIGGGINDLLAVGGNLSLSGVTTFTVTPVGALNNTTNYTLMTYAGALSGYASNINVTCISPRYTFAVVDPNNPANPTNLIQAKLTSTVSGNLLWHGGVTGNATTWDINNTANWLNGGSPDKFFNSDAANFDDTALTNRVTLSGALAPSSVTMSNTTKAYLFSGTGSLAAGGALTVYGSGSLTLSNNAANTFGGIVMNAGSLTIANPVAQSLGTVTLNNNSTVTLANPVPDTLGTLTLNDTSLANVVNNAANNFATVNLNGGTLAFNQPTNVTFSGTLTGTGTLAKQGTSTLTLAEDASAFTGTIQGNNGVLQVGASGALNSSGVSIASGATLDVNGISTVSGVTVTVIGNGFGGLGAIDNLSSTYQNFALHNGALAGDTTFRATGAGWEMLAPNTSDPSSFAGGGFKLTKYGTNDIYFGTTGDTDLGDIDVKEGFLGFETARGGAANCTMGRLANTITVSSNAIIGFWPPNVAGEKQIVLQDGAILGGGASGTAEFGGPSSKVTLNGTNYVEFVFYSTTGTPPFAGGILQCDSEITGSGVLVLRTNGLASHATPWSNFHGTNTVVGTFILNAANTFTNPVIVNGGVLQLLNNLALNTNGTVIVNNIPFSGSGVVAGNQVPRVELSGGVVIPPATTVYLNSSTGPGATNDYRTTFGVTTATANEYQGTLVLQGDDAISFDADAAASALTISGPITNLNFTGGLGLRGRGAFVFSGPIHTGAGNISQNFTTTGPRTVTISSTGNQWASYDVAHGTLNLGATDALCTTAPLAVESSFDMAGFNQTVGQLGDSANTGIIFNDSGGGQSVLTVNGGANISIWDGTILDFGSNPGGTVAVTVASGALVMNGANTYTGPTVVQSGGALGGNGSLLSPVTVQSGGALAPGASIGQLGITNTLTLNPGSFSVFEVDAGTLASDLVAGLTSVTYGGTLVVTNVSVTPLSGGQSFKLFDSAAYVGSFAAIIPATPGSGMVWNTNSLTVDGTLKVVSTGAPNFTGATLTGAHDIQFTIAGNLGSAYSLRYSTNLSAPVATWQVLTNSTVTSSPFTIHDATATNKQRFYRISSP